MTVFVRPYPLHFFNDQGWLKVPAPLWLTLALGLQHLLFLAPTLHKVLPELGELQLSAWLIADDLLVVLLLLCMGHRMSGGGLQFMRKVWRAGWFLLTAAYVIGLAGFVLLHWGIITWPGHRLHYWSLFVLAINILPLSYLLLSRHARDVFSFSPAQLESPSESADLADQQNQGGGAATTQGPSSGVSPGLALRRHEAQKTLTRYPVLETATEPEKKARQALDGNPENAQLWHDLGIFYLQQNYLEQAADFVRHASLIDGANPLYLRNLGELSRRCGRLQEAVEAGLAAAKLSPQDPEAYFNLGVIYTSARRPKLAEQNYLRALALKPDHQAAQQNLAALRARPAA